MKRIAFALVTHERSEPCQSLKPILRRFGVDTFSVRSCAGAFRLLEQTHPHLIFTDTQLPDGTWIDLVNKVEDSAIPTCVIIVGSPEDQKIFEASLHGGAFGFISPPFDDEAVSRLIHQAMTQVRALRERHSRTAAA